MKKTVFQGSAVVPIPAMNGGFALQSVRAAERLLACLQKYGLAEPAARVGTVTIKRPQGTLLWRKNH